MPMTLRADLHAALVDDDVVLLDVATDRYVCLPQLAPAWRAGVSPDGALEAAELAAALSAAGLAAAGGARPPPIPMPPPARTAIGAPAAPVTGRLLRALAGCLWDVVWGYRGRPLAEILRRPRSGRGGPGPADEAEVLRLSSAFERLAVWLPLPGKCLVRSFALLRFLQRCGCDARWCFGVRTWPFSAHCWLQVGDLVLDDHPDQLRAYVLIHVV